MTTINQSLVERYGAYYAPGYVSSPALVRELLGLKWLTQRTARHEYFMSLVPRDYTYGNKGTGNETYKSQPFEFWTKVLMDSINEDFGYKLNVCFLNKYDNEHQHLGWHADDFPGMRADQPIVCASFGAEREIWVKRKGETGLVPASQRIKLEQGSLFIMPPGYQDTHLHRIPKHDRPCGWRISLTYRSFQ